MKRIHLVLASILIYYQLFTKVDAQQPTNVNEDCVLRANLNYVLDVSNNAHQFAALLDNEMNGVLKDNAFFASADFAAGEANSSSSEEVYMYESSSPTPPLAIKKGKTSSLKASIIIAAIAVGLLVLFAGKQKLITNTICRIVEACGDMAAEYAMVRGPYVDESWFNPSCGITRVLLILGLLFVGQLISSVDAQELSHTCINLSNETRASLDERNIKLSKRWVYNMTPAASQYKFYNSSRGGLYTLYQCREDLSLDACSTCVGTAASTISQDCPLYNEAVVYYKGCMLRYAYGRNFFSLTETQPSYQQSYGNDTDFGKNDPVWTKAMDDLIDAAATNKTTAGIYFAATATNLTSSKTLYTLAQCTPGITTSGCRTCLKAALANITACCNGVTTLVIFLPSCQLRISNITSFLTNLESVATPPVTPVKPISPATIVAISAGSAGSLLLLLGLCLCLRRKRLQKSFELLAQLEAMDGSQYGNMDDMGSLESLQYDFSVVQSATCNFSNDNKLGQGGFGEVYKGKFSNGKEIAVKRLAKDSQQGNTEFKNEVILVAKLQHRNLVKLLGFCLTGKEKILIYEFLSNSSLDRFLYDPIKRAFLGWEVRYKIITGVARGLLYLHEDSRLKIIHRDLKSSNILLDDSMNAKIADFGLAKLFDSDQNEADTMRIAGTFGYMAPEYAMAGQFSVKSDVYSFGVIILEIVSGQRNSFLSRKADEEGLLPRAWKHWNEGAPLELVDPELKNVFSEEEVKLCVLIGLLCIQEDPTYRPRMTTVAAALNGDPITLPLPNAPHLFTCGSNSMLDDITTTTSNYDSLPSNEMKRTISGPGNEPSTGTIKTSDVSPR